MFREAKPRETSTVEGPQIHKTYCFAEVSVNKYFIIYQESKKRKSKANFIRKYMKYFINFVNRKHIRNIRCVRLSKGRVFT